MSFKRFTLFFFVAALLFLAACGSGNADGAGDSESDNNEELSGNIAIDGSGTVYPLMARLAEDYMINEQQGVSVEVSRAGTSAGFKKFLDENGTDFNDASREIKEEEQAKADELGIEVQELKVALDGLTIVTHPDNDWATELTPEQVQGIFLGDYTKWSDIDDSWPNEDIKTYGPNENHGTYEFFYEEILEEQDLVEGIDLQQDYSTLVTLISEDKNAIGFFGFGYYQSNQDTINAVSIDFGEGAIEPSLDTIAEDGPYADYTRPVFTYLNVNHAQEKPEVLDYAKYVLENTNNVAGETGFAPIPDEEVQSQMEVLEGIE
ncbi:PstS family phosphate ABC transporter substrate-binding protein [Oceanobacillus jeddahense]|uniref:Phosphate-binding protein n=1 Tax=Oceanobacillus jeddahense TaxID=1462527 RepID=A0ABY5JSK2_9BACI|nr:PstS family phosphate ABC transporter substrate-binding protein [Oceanobacillus jeddahense]UUI02764.1 PstS family phosphate ABC transporter substrate-binding protein [Oceanobacillus jeddahense]